MCVAADLQHQPGAVTEVWASSFLCEAETGRAVYYRKHVVHSGFPLNTTFYQVSG